MKGYRVTTTGGVRSRRTRREHFELISKRESTLKLIDGTKKIRIERLSSVQHVRVNKTSELHGVHLLKLAIVYEDGY